MISSHILDELAKVADSFGIIHEGRLLDEFTTDELSDRCGEYVTVKCEDNDAAEKVLKEAGYTEIERDHNNNLRILNALDNTDDMILKLVKADIKVKELFITRLSLEDYYLNMTGGH